MARRQWPATVLTAWALWARPIGALLLRTPTSLQYVHGRGCAALAAAAAAPFPRVAVSANEVSLEVERSKFIARVSPAASADAALVCVQASRLLDPKASHHCWAWRGRAAGTGRCSDDGEPSSTAGRPILGALESEGVVDTVVVVARYFGGTKLGTGGLVRAYGQSARLALQSAELRQVVEMTRLTVQLQNHQDAARVYALLGKLEATKVEEEFDSKGRCSLILNLPDSKKETAVKLLTEATAGRASIL